MLPISTVFFADFTNFLQCIYLENDKPVKYWHIDPLLFRLFLSSKCNKSKINAFYPHCLECQDLQKPKKQICDNVYVISIIILYVPYCQ